MKNQRLFLFIAVCLLGGFGLFLGNGTVTPTTSTVTAATPSPTPTPTPRIVRSTDIPAPPPQILYLQLFKHIAVLKDKQNQSLAAGQNTSWTQTFYSQKMGLNSTQSQSVEQIAMNCLSQVATYDQQAKTIIDQARAQFPNGKLTGKQLPPLPPAQLLTLQRSKDSVVLSAKDSIRQSLGDSKFTQFNVAVEKNVTKMIVPLFKNHQPDRDPYNN